MAIHPISFEKFGNKRFLRTNNYNFVSKETTVNLVVQEFTKVATSFPIGFIHSGDGYTPIALLGFHSGKNLYVSPEGRWLGGYIPAALRGFPFLLAEVEGGARQLLCIDDGFGSISDTEGEAFFGEDQQPTKVVKETLNFLNQVSSNRLLTRKIMAVIQKHQLITPWSIRVQSPGQQEQIVEGIFRVNESVLEGLSAEALQELHLSRALPLMYFQLLSMQHLPNLGKLAQVQYDTDQVTATLAKNNIEALDISFSADDMTISFENFK
jgi:hypothetical protein